MAAKTQTNAKTQTKTPRSRIDDVLAALEALRQGEADALLCGPGVYTRAGAEAPYFTFFEAMNEGGLSLDRHGRILAANPRFAAMTGDRAGNLRGRLLRDLLASGDWPRLADLLARGSAGACEARLRSRDGELLPVRVSARPMGIEGQDLSCLVVTDLSDRQRAEDALREVNRDLSLRSTELSTANDELESFVYAVTHNLRAPLRAMNGFAQALTEDYSDQLDETARGCLSQITAASARMAELIEGILTLGRSTRGDSRDDQVDLTGLAHRLLLELADGEPGRRLEMYIQSGMAVVGQPGMVTTVLANLVDNAWKFTRNNEITVIRVYTEERDGQLWYCVTDNGVGFDMAHGNRLFQPFQRLHRQDEFPGTGIGLATAYRIIQRHHGHIQAHGRPGRGATLSFTWPEETFAEPP